MPAISPALQDLTPTRCRIVESGGRPVPLSTAGYVLRFGTSYRLQLGLPFVDADSVRVRVLAPPDFVSIEPELKGLDDHGRPVRSVPFRVQPEHGLTPRRFFPDVRCGELTINYEFGPGPHRPLPDFSVPIVVYRGWVWTIVLGLLGLLFPWVSEAAKDILMAGQGREGVWEGLLLRVLADPLLLGCVLLLVAGAVLVGPAVTWWLLRTRSHELRRRFRALYP